MIKKIALTIAFVAGCYLLFLLTGSAKSPQQRPNVLFIFVDDLRPDLKIYGNPLVQAPNLDELARQSTVFTNQYVTQPTCGASRFSLLTGRRPQNTNQIKNEAIENEIAGKPRTDAPETFIDNLRRNGYYTVGIGKISHSPDGFVYGYDQPKGTRPELPNSWDEMVFNPGKWVTGWNAFFGYADGSNRQGRKGEVAPYEAAEVGDDGYPDGLTADLAIEKLKELAGKKQPFFLGVGFFKPHLPFNAPRRYWDLYDESKITLTHSPEIPENVNTASLHQSSEFNQYNLGDEKASLEKPVSNDYARKLRHAYYAAISYTDAQIGKVLDQLKKSGLYDSTIIVVWSDHGWHLGDYRVWGKHTIFDQSLKSVLIVKTPGLTTGTVRKQTISSIDIYPTLMELCSVKTLPELDGKSFTGLLKKLDSNNWENVAYSYYNRGMTVRTARYRLTKYFRAKEPHIELYDHETDAYENHNIAARYPEVVRQLTETLEKGNTGLFR